MRVWGLALFVASTIASTSGQANAPYIAAGAIVSVSEWDSSTRHARGNDDLRTAMLAAHNAARRQAGIGELTWDEALSREAADYAREIARSRRFAHSEREGQGENLWMGTASAYAYGEMIESWTDERRNYREGRFPEVSRTKLWSDVAHYTQVIWGGTRTVGCATASNDEDDVLVCRYFPAGNVYGEVATEGPRIRSASLAQATAR